MKMFYKLLCVGVAATALSPKLLANCEKPFTKKMYCSAKAEADKNPDAKYLEEGKCRRVKKNGKDKKVCNKDGKITVKDVDPKDSSSSHQSKDSDKASKSDSKADK